MSRKLLLVLPIIMVAPLRTAGAQAFVDPAPPRLVPVPDVPAPEPKAHRGLTYRSAPKPLAAGAVTHDWRDFLGPSHNGISSEAPLLKAFDKGRPAVVWEVEKGEGYASPAVVGSRVVLFHRVGDEDVIECLHAETGKRFWRTAYPTDYSDRYGFSGGPRCQPVSDGERVYVLGAEGKLLCLKLTTGQVVWKRNILAEFKLKQNFFGVGATPLLEGDLLIVNVGAESGPCAAAFDKRTGKMVWGAGKKWSPGYASPVAAAVQGKRRVFVFTGGEKQPSDGGLLCIDPANGKVDFELPWRGRRFESVNASAPLIVGNQVFISECYGPGGTLLEVQSNGSYKQLWTTDALQTHFATAIHKDGYLYSISGHGPQNAPLVCIDMKTGKEVWREDIEWQETVGGQRRRYIAGLASLMLVDGRCLLLGELGDLAWIDLNPKGYKELGHTRLFLAPYTWSMPALSRGLLYVCQNDRSIDGKPARLICYDLRGTK